MKRSAANRHIRIAQMDTDCGCEKTTYASKPDAEKSAQIARRRAHEPIHAYPCPNGGWHIGHAMERGRTA